VQFEPALDEYARTLMFDAQTSGGLLLCLPAASQQAFLTAAAARALPAWVIGSVEAGSGIDVRDTGTPSSTAGGAGSVFLAGD
jgi:selenophosphate synthase